MPIKLIRMMDSYSERVDKEESKRLQDLRIVAIRLVAEIDKVLESRGDAIPVLLEVETPPKFEAK